MGGDTMTGTDPYSALEGTANHFATGMSYEYFVNVHGWASIKYLPLKNGYRDGVEVLMKDDGTIHGKTHWVQNQFHGPNDWYYFNGRPRKRPSMK